MDFIVRTESDLQRFLRPEGILHPFRKPRACLRIPGMPGPEALAWESRLEELRSQCGCSAGALAIFIFFVSCILYSLHAGGPAPGTAWPRSLLFIESFFVAGLVVSALLGKLVGLLLATLRLRRACLELQGRLRALQALTAAAS